MGGREWGLARARALSPKEILQAGQARRAFKNRGFYVEKDVWKKIALKS